MSTLGLWLISVGLAGLSASIAGPAVTLLTARGRSRKLAERLPRTRIAEASAGELIKVVGRVEYETEPLVAPFSGRACAHYEAAVEVRTKHGFRRKVEQVRSTSLVVADETGRALVEPDKLLVDVVIDHHWASADLDHETRFELEQFLFQAGDAGSRLLQDPGRLRYVEGVLEQGELVTVVGVAAWGRATEPGVGYRDLTRRLVLEPPRRGGVYVSDGAHFAS
ncbi:MAG: hypothetical protein JNL21_06010 [Myxococcales bacterium]|nr:hypothetical protein [Myxococcales bacterium]